MPPTNKSRYTPRKTGSGLIPVSNDLERRLTASILELTEEGQKLRSDLHAALSMNAFLAFQTTAERDRAAILEGQTQDTATIKEEWLRLEAAKREFGDRSREFESLKIELDDARGALESTKAGVEQKMRDMDICWSKMAFKQAALEGARRLQRAEEAERVLNLATGFAALHAERRMFMEEKSQYMEEKSQFMEEKNQLMEDQNEFMEDQNDFMEEQNEFMAKKIAFIVFLQEGSPVAASPNPLGRKPRKEFDSEPKVCTNTYCKKMQTSCWRYDRSKSPPALLCNACSQYLKRTKRVRLSPSEEVVAMEEVVEEVVV